ncbi:PspC domain-containing protein [Polaribacter tangerinus]|uniref:PspC domain-containing protein n=1 Tax=Polaribacter tangerinus TaxID=1920034 RepID=UPI000B4AF887|nr:PspC domain-containing protein [Polaribacter tangerinus]
MNKTININLGGFFFHIDEIAYQKLRRYLESIAKSLSEDSQGKNEIIADIEARISELLSEKITDSRQVVNEKDIEDIIAIMGQPEDYAEAEEGYSDTKYAYQRNNQNKKKLFRDGEDKFLGGVASGIAHYFNIDSIWIRLAFLVSTLAGLGAGIFIYIILWILLPEAKTTAEKLQMEGEPVNIDNIEKKIREEFTHVSESVKNAANSASEKLKEGANEFSEKVHQKFSAKTKKNNGLQDFLDTIGKIFLVFFKVIGKLIGILLVFIAAAVILVLTIGGFSVGSLEFLNFNGEIVQYPPFFYDATLPLWLLTVVSFVLAAIPFVVLFVLGLRILSNNVKKFNKTTSLTLLGIWILCLLAIIFTGIEYATTQAFDGKHIEKNNLILAKKDTLVLKMKNDDTIYYQQNFRTSARKYKITVKNTELIYTNNIGVDVKRSTTNQAYFIIQKESNGKSTADANINAKKIAYNFEIYNNEVLLNSYFLTDLSNLFKDEEIAITFFIPEATTVYFDDSIKNFLDDVKNEENIYDTDMGSHYFMMTDKTLKCTDCITDTKDNSISKEW